MPGRLRCTPSPSIAIQNNKEPCQSLYDNNSNNDDNNNNNNNMSTFEFSIDLPKRIKTGDPIYPPPIVSMSVPSGAYPSKRFCAHISLLRNGKVTEGLVGEMSYDGPPTPSSSPSTEAYIFAMPELQIIDVGIFQIRVTILELNAQGGNVLHQFNSREVEAVDFPETLPPPTPEQQAIMDIAKAAGALT